MPQTYYSIMLTEAQYDALRRLQNKFTATNRADLTDINEILQIDLMDNIIELKV